MVEPFLKWAGGKRWLAGSEFMPNPKNYNRYVEPFLGGGAVYFQYEPSYAVLADINRELINLYKVMRDYPEQLMARMLRHQAQHSAGYFYSIRQEVPVAPIERAARTLYLNRTCWNGLYRVNGDGIFNVPVGTKSTVVFPGDDFCAVSRVLRAADIICADFEPIIAGCGSGDFLFVDPPYAVQHESGGFVKYNDKLFGWSDQIRLRDVLLRAIRRGAAVVLTNADHESVRALYAGICDYYSLQRHSVLAGQSSGRKKTSEALFLANVELPCGA